jgi:hypothetical protein
MIKGANITLCVVLEKDPGYLLLAGFLKTWKSYDLDRDELGKATYASAQATACRTHR